MKCLLQGVLQGLGRSINNSSIASGGSSADTMSINAGINVGPVVINAAPFGTR